MKPTKCRAREKKMRQGKRKKPEYNDTNMNPQAKKQRFWKLSKKFPEEKEQLEEENDADNIRKVLSGFKN